MSSSTGISVCSYLTLGLGLLFAFLIQYFFQHDFIYGKVLSRDDFNHPLNYTIENVSTTYYCTSSELDNILSQWDDRPIHLYRREKRCEAPLHLEALQGIVRARRLIDNCTNKSTICAQSSCIPPKEDVHLMDIQEVLVDPGWYVSFDGK